MAGPARVVVVVVAEPSRATTATARSVGAGAGRRQTILGQLVLCAGLSTNAGVDAHLVFQLHTRGVLLRSHLPVRQPDWAGAAGSLFWIVITEYTMFL